LIRFPVDDRQWAYVHFIGGGIWGDAVRVLPGLFTEELSVEDLIELASREERFVIQTFVLSVMELPGARVETVIETQDSWDLVPWWVSAPVRIALRTVGS
jgi:hypothetical protein